MADDFHRFWELRGGAAAFEAWRKGAPVPKLLIRVVGPDFVAGFTVDDQVRECAPILRKALAGMTEAQARRAIRRRGWRATVVKDATATDLLDVDQQQAV